ncbi:MAG TPA: hypothetical protein VE258_08930 [Ktedonobacterales bacterium]|nr:hypothetical protein [Ktedonobacterales bacterium]
MSQATTRSPVEEVVDFFSHGPSRDEIAAFQLSNASQERLRKLLDKNAASALSEDEERELDRMVLLDDIVSLIRARVHRPGADAAGSLEE